MLTGKRLATTFRKITTNTNAKSNKNINKNFDKTIVEVKTEPRAKRSENKYIRLGMDAKMEERKAFSERVQKGELKLAYYATDSDVGYHYYLVIK